MVFVMETSTSPTKFAEVRSYVELQQRIHEALRKQHPEWVEPNGDCPTCDSYELRLAQLLGLSPAKKDRTGPLTSLAREQQNSPV
jgi:hypothetical protein